ncbi:MAG: sigma-54 dependent transcriptional regulator [Deltaproteobacteria bacterium]|nr:sigma-54 dependent transcriptional regulator [Deltaproteobacteria bacterium]
MPKGGELSEASHGCHAPVIGVIPRLLLAEDEPQLREEFRRMLVGAGYQVEAVANGVQALQQLQANRYDILISDTSVSKEDGLAFYWRVRKQFPGTDVVLMSSSGDVHEALEALRTVTPHYLARPFEAKRLVAVVDDVVGLRRISSRPPPGPRAAPDALVGQSVAMVALRELMAAIGPSDSAVVISGETGTGKELVALELHRTSPRRDEPFVAINCAAFPESLIEAELFGYERGAFTGATQRRPGRFVAANGGTLFLDEVTDLPLPVQAKLLRVLQEGAFQPLGTNRTQSVDVRILSATNADLDERVKDGRFREDLYYRLKVFRLHIKPLRERLGDLPVLVAHFLSAFENAGAKRSEFTARAWAAVKGYSFPGNVRELQHAIEHAAVLSNGGPIEVQHLPEEIRGAQFESGEAPASEQSLFEALAEFEREYLRRILEQVGWQRRRAAQVLGISRKTLWSKLRAHGLHGKKK